MSLYITLSIVLIIIAFTLWLFFDSRSWHESKGTIEYIELEKVHNDTISPMSTNKKFTEYKINMEYSYSVNNINYKGSQFYPLIPNVFSDEKHAQELINKYQNAREITVYYSPKNPGNSCLITSKNISPLKYGLMVAIFFMFAIILAVGIKYFNSIFEN